MISFPTPSRKAAHFNAGNPPATAPPTRSPASTHASAAYSPFLRGLSPSHALASHPYRLSHNLLSPIAAIVGAPNSP
jgi:hypothetical protein